MPTELENKLKAEAAKKGLMGKHADAYVYGTMRKTGWKPGVTSEAMMRKNVMAMRAKGKK